MDDAPLADQRGLDLAIRVLDAGARKDDAVLDLCAPYGAVRADRGVRADVGVVDDRARADDGGSPDGAVAKLCSRFDDDLAFDAHILSDLAFPAGRHVVEDDP